MDAYALVDGEVAVQAVMDTFFDVEFDQFSQSGSDWYRLALAASHAGKVVHGATLTASCETLAKVDEDFAKLHATARIQANMRVKEVKQPSTEWCEQVLSGKMYYGTSTENKARMLFDTAEWEPATRTRAANAAFVGGLLCTQGASLADACTIASAVAGEPVPEEAVVNTELPLSVLKREAAAMAKHNHIVYSYANTQRAIVWDAHQFHEQVLPRDAALDWSRVTTIARYIAEANMTLDPRFLHYATEVGVPYTLVRGSWASVHAADYIYDASEFLGIPLTAGAQLPTPELASQYDKQAANLYDAIHRMANEVKTGLSDLTIDSLLRISEKYKRRQGPIKEARTVGTALLMDTSLHRYSAELAAQQVAQSSRSWDALVSATVELVGSNRALKAACSSLVAAYKQHEAWELHAEALMLELCDTAIWLRAFDYLKANLGNHYKARERISKLKRSMLNNSAPLETPTVLSSRSRHALLQKVAQLASLALVGKMPMARLSVDARRVVAHQNMDRHAELFSSVNAHMSLSRLEWSQRYQKMAETYKIAGGPNNSRLSILYGCAARAFGMANAYLMSRPDDGFVDPHNLQTSYLVSAANNYIRKRHITKPNLQPLVGMTAQDQAMALDQMLAPDVPFADVYEFCNKRLTEFYSDIVSGAKPAMRDEDPQPGPVQEEGGGLSEEQALQILMGMPEPDEPRITYAMVMNTYSSERMADDHAKANGYTDFLDAFTKLADRARYDTDTTYTEIGLKADYARAKMEEAEGDAPVI